MPISQLVSGEGEPVAAVGEIRAKTLASKRTLLVVDDEPDVLDSIRYLFHRNYRVLTAGGGEEAKGLLEKNDVHIILSDQRMPGMTGDALLSYARAHHPDAIRMIFTGYADLESVVRAVNEGNIFRYIVKPWDSAELESIIGQAAEQYELLAERKRLIAELQGINTKLVEANVELAEASQLKTSFIEVASHEFNTPITLVLGLSELLLLLNPMRDSSEQQIVEQIAGSAKQLARLVAETLKLLRTDNFGQTVHCGPVELASLLHEAADRLLPFVETRRMFFTVDISPDLGTFEIDAPKVRDAVLNLLTNALKFTPDGGQIGLSARLTSEDEVEIIVSDEGIGIEPRALRRLFEPFFTEFDPSRHSTGDFGYQKRGLGLGLSIVRQFVELHGGRIQATSERGSGTRVTVHLPRRSFPKSSAAIESPSRDGNTLPGESGP